MGNFSLATLLQPEAQNPPSFSFNEDSHLHVAVSRASLQDVLEGKVLDEVVEEDGEDEERHGRRTVTAGTESKRSVIAELRPSPLNMGKVHAAFSLRSDFSQAISTPASKSSVKHMFGLFSSKPKKERGFAKIASITSTRRDSE